MEWEAERLETRDQEISWVLRQEFRLQENERQGGGQRGAAWKVAGRTDGVRKCGCGACVYGSQFGVIFTVFDQ